MRKTIGALPDDAIEVESFDVFDGSNYTTLSKNETSWYVTCLTSCSGCGSESYDVDEFDDEEEAREWYKEQCWRTW